MGAPLRDGVYEQLVTQLLQRQIDGIAPSVAEIAKVQTADLSTWLTRHLSAEIYRVLRASADPDAQIALAHHLLDQLARPAPGGAEPGPDDDAREAIEAARIAGAARLLRSIYRTVPPERPATPLSSSTLLTRSKGEPALGHELGREVACADRVDILSAFITVGGLRAIRQDLERASRRGVRVRVLTSVFTGTTEVAALTQLAALEGAEVRVSYDTQRTRLHAKAWLFQRDSGLHTAYVGSANWTSTALGSGHEWMVKVSATDLPDVIAKFEGTFESLWNDSEFEPFDASSVEQRDRLQRALKAEKTAATDVTQLYALKPFAYQLEILDKLQAERRLHGRWKNLVVAATGTGKTVIAAFDYANECRIAGAPPRLLFLAHRKEILDQALHTFRNAMHDGGFGELFVDGHVPERWEHVFASIQSVANAIGNGVVGDGGRFAADHFRFVVIDECHHAPADSYQKVIRAITPEILVGLTATPERTDSKSLLPDFGGRIAAELRLWHALEKQLLVPFEYYGISDNTDLRGIRWNRGSYQTADLENVYTGNQARVDLVVEQIRRRVGDIARIRAIAFCVSVQHAEWMAKELTKRGVPAEAVHGGTPSDVREAAPKRLRERATSVICTVDLYNEGIDLPFVDTLLLLRPTASATVFVQQLGRGLRLHRENGVEKASCLVLDFIGQHHSEFRFDGLYAAITGRPRARLAKEIAEGFPFLPSGCVLQLDEVARTQIVDALKRVVASARVLTRELQEYRAANDTVTLKGFLEETGRDVEDVYDAGGWTEIRERAGVLPPQPEATKDLTKGFKRLVHTDDPKQLALWQRGGILRAAEDVVERRRVTMLEHQLRERTMLADPKEGLPWLFGDEIAREELSELGTVLTDRIASANDVHPVPEWPLAVHRHYSRREIVAAVGYVTPGQKGNIPQGGILKLDGKRELLLVTLDKSDASFSPTTRYRDYAISPTLFHWETQAIASVERESGRRYVGSPGNGWSFYLFVRPRSDAAYAFLGPVTFVSAAGDRPIGITWRLEHEMSGALFDRNASLAQ